MTSCEQCGTELNSEAPSCPACGKIRESLAAPLSEAQKSAGTAQVNTSFDDIAGLSAKWRERFAAIEKAGTKYILTGRLSTAEASLMTVKERRLLKFNAWACLFGPLYYLYLGMWRKAIPLTLITAAIDVVLGLMGDAIRLPIDNTLWIVSVVIFQFGVNRDYYRKMVLKQKHWW